MLRVRDVAKHFGVHKTTVYRWVHLGFLPAYRKGQLIKPGEETTGLILIPEFVLNSPPPAPTPPVEQVAS